MTATYTMPSPMPVANDGEETDGLTFASHQHAIAAPVALTDAATILVNAQLGFLFRVTLAGSRTIAAPSNPVDGQRITFELKQDGTGSRLITWTSTAGGFSFGGQSAPTLTTTAAKTDRVSFVYNAAANKWWYDGSELAF